MRRAQHMHLLITVKTVKEKTIGSSYIFNCRHTERLLNYIQIANELSMRIERRTGLRWCIYRRVVEESKQRQGSRIRVKDKFCHCERPTGARQSCCSMQKRRDCFVAPNAFGTPRNDTFFVIARLPHMDFFTTK